VHKLILHKIKHDYNEFTEVTALPPSFGLNKRKLDRGSLLI
jgi:hypothetical protein